MRTNSREIDEHLKHVRSIITQFLAKLPITSKDNEEILTVVYSMLNFPREEIDQISEARSKLMPEKPVKKKCAASQIMESGGAMSIFAETWPHQARHNNGRISWG